MAEDTQLLPLAPEAASTTTFLRSSRLPVEPLSQWMEERLEYYNGADNGISTSLAGQATRLRQPKGKPRYKHRPAKPAPKGAGAEEKSKLLQAAILKAVDREALTVEQIAEIVSALGSKQTVRKHLSRLTDALKVVHREDPESGLAYYTSWSLAVKQLKDKPIGDVREKPEDGRGRLGVAALAGACGAHEREIYRILTHEQPTIPLDMADRILHHEGTTELNDLWPELEYLVFPADAKNTHQALKESALDGRHDLHPALYEHFERGLSGDEKVRNMQVRQFEELLEQDPIEEEDER